MHMNHHRRRHLFALVVLGAGTLVSPAFAASPVPPGGKHKVVIQVSDADHQKWYLALNNASNVQKDIGKDKVDIEVVAYGPGIGMLKADALNANQVMEAMKEGVVFLACENTMQAQHLTREDMIDNIGYVKAGVVHIMKRQQEGWAYLRP